MELGVNQHMLVEPQANDFVIKNGINPVEIGLNKKTATLNELFVLCWILTVPFIK